jgi:hypothetical protein
MKTTSGGQPTGIEEHQAQGFLSTVYFSTADHNITANIQAINPGKYSLDIYDAQGRCVRTSEHTLSLPDNYTFVYSTAGMARGVYFVRIQGRDLPAIHKVLLQ